MIKENTKENLDSKDQKNFSEPQKPKITDQSQANNIQKIKELNYKISVLIKGIKEEIGKEYEDAELQEALEKLAKYGTDLSFEEFENIIMNIK